MNKLTREKLRRWRGEMSMEQAGRIFGVSGVQWFRYEKGQREIAADKVVRFEKLTRISRHELRPDVFGSAKGKTK